MKIYFKVLIAAILFTLSACGGGTTGTGDTRTASFNGRVLTASNVALPDAEVTVLETGESSISDANGAFSIQTDLSGDSATLLIRAGDKEGSTLVNNIPAGNTTINLDIQVDVVSGNVQIISIQVNPVETPAPNATPDANSTPNPDNTPSPDKSGESILQGVLLYSDNIPVKGARMQFGAAKVDTQTNANGKFSLKFKSFNGESLLKITKDKIKSELKIGNFKKSEDVIVTLQLKLDISSKAPASASNNQLVPVLIEKQTTKANN